MVSIINMQIDRRTAFYMKAKGPGGFLFHKPTMPSSNVHFHLIKGCIKPSYMQIYLSRKTFLRYTVTIKKKKTGTFLHSSRLKSVYFHIYSEEYSHHRGVSSVLSALTSCRNQYSTAFCTLFAEPILAEQLISLSLVQSCLQTPEKQSSPNSFQTQPQQACRLPTQRRCKNM